MSDSRGGKIVERIEWEWERERKRKMKDAAAAPGGYCHRGGIVVRNQTKQLPAYDCVDVSLALLSAFMFVFVSVAKNRCRRPLSAPHHTPRCERVPGWTFELCASASCSWRNRLCKRSSYDKWASRTERKKGGEGRELANKSGKRLLRTLSSARENELCPGSIGFDITSETNQASIQRKNQWQMIDIRIWMVKLTQFNSVYCYSPSYLSPIFPSLYNSFLSFLFSERFSASLSSPFPFININFKVSSPALASWISQHNRRETLTNGNSFTYPQKYPLKLV